MLTQDGSHDSASHPRTSSPKLPEDGGQELDRYSSEKEEIKGMGSPLFTHQFRHKFDGTTESKEQSSQQHSTSDLDCVSRDYCTDGQQHEGSDQSLVQAHMNLVETLLSQNFKDSPTSEGKNHKNLDPTSTGSPDETLQLPAKSQEVVHSGQHPLKGVYKSRGTQTPPVSISSKTKHDGLTQTAPTSTEAATRTQPKISKTKAPLRSAWKPDESPSLRQRSLGRRLPALPKPKPLRLKVQLTQLPREPAGLPQKQVTMKKSSGSKKRNQRDSAQWVTDEHKDSSESLDLTNSEKNSIGTPAWLRQLTLPHFPTSPFHRVSSGSKGGSGSYSYEPSESGSRNNFEFTPSHQPVKSPSPTQQSFESATIQSSESDWSTQPKVPPEVDALTTAAAAGDMMTVKRLLKNGVDVNAANSFGRTAIQVMIHDNPDLAEMLMKAGADPNTCDVGKKAASSTFRTIAHDVAASGYTDTLRCLLRHGADINLQDRWGNTPLHLAAKSGHLPAVRLLRRGTSLYTPNHQGRTPIAILEELTDPAVQQWVQMKKTNASRLQTLCVLAVRKELGTYGLRCWCRHAPDAVIQRQVLLQSRSPPPLTSASTLLSNRQAAGLKMQKSRGRGSAGCQSLMAALTSGQLLDFLTLRDLIPRRLSSGENTSLEVQNTSSLHSSDDVLSLGPNATSSQASENGSLFDANLSSIDASHSTVDDVSLPSLDQSL